MVTLLITSVLLFGIILVALYIWQKPRVRQAFEELPAPPTSRSLFDDVAPAAALNSAQLNQHSLDSLLAQAHQGDKSTLKKAYDLRDRVIYDEVLTALVNGARSDAQILSLTSHVTRNQWPVNKPLAAAVINSWQKTPDRSSTAKMLHIAALSDDAETYRKAVELALRAWRDGKLVDLRALELNALLTGEFWVLSSATRSSGAGFILKRSLASARRELERAKHAN